MFLDGMEDSAVSSGRALRATSSCDFMTDEMMLMHSCSGSPLLHMGSREKK